MLTSWLSGGVIGLTLVATWYLRAKFWPRLVLFTMLATGALLGPVLGFLDVGIMRHTPVQDHEAYLAVAAFAAAFAAGFGRLWTWRVSRPRFWRQGLAVAAACVVVVAGAASWHDAAAFQDNETVWTQALAKYPDLAIGHLNLGNERHNVGRDVEAIAHYSEVVRLKPRSLDAHRNWGLAAAALKRYDEALAQLQIAQEINPNNALVWHVQGLVLAETGRAADAEAALRKALALVPAMASAHYDLGVLLQRAGRDEEALQEFAATTTLFPEHYTAWNNAAIILHRRGEVKNAILYYQKALAAAPDFQLAKFNLGVALIATGDSDEGVRLLSEVVVVDGSMAKRAWPSVMVLAAAGKSQQRRPRLALELAQNCCRALACDDGQTKLVLAAVFAANGDFTQANANLAQASARLAPEDAANRKLLAEMQERFARGEPYLSADGS